MSMLITAAKTLAIAGLLIVTIIHGPTTARADPDNQVNNDKLFAMLSGGYTPADCQASKQYPEDPFLARLGCGPNGQEGGPTGATFSLYATDADMNAAFNRRLGDPIACSETTGPGPVSWSVGMVQCSHNSRAGTALSWTRNADLLVGVVSGSDVGSLYNWWLTAR
jgi:hypothetical protein